MTDPRRDKYRAECAAAARRGVVLINYPKAYSLFLSNLNDNVNEQLLREELVRCGPLTLVKIPTLHGRSLGLARVDLEPGVEPDQFIKHFHGRELLGQRMSVIVDRRAKKFEQAMQDAKSPKKVEPTKEVPQPSPKKRARTTDSPNYSPASPARPISDCDGPSPLKPKRPRCNSPMGSPQRHPRTRLSGETNNETNRSQGERQFSQDRRDSYRGYGSASRTYPRSFAKESPHDYRERYQEGDDRYDNRTSFHNRNRFHPGDSRHHRHESFGEYPSHPPSHRGRYDGHRDNDRRNSGGYTNRYRSHPRPYASGHNPYSSDRHGDYRASGPTTLIRQGAPCDGKQVEEPIWVDDTRPALTVMGVLRGAVPADLLYAFRIFRPKGTLNSGYGNWKVWFDSTEDRDSAFSLRGFRVRNRAVEITPTNHVVGRKSTFNGAPYGTQRYEGQPRDFDKRKQSDVEPLEGNEIGPSKFEHREERFSRRDTRYEGHRKDHHPERRISGQSSSYRGVDDRSSSRTELPHHAPNSAYVSPGQRNATELRDGRYYAKERHHREHRNGLHHKAFPDRRWTDELRRPEIVKHQERRKGETSVSRRVGEGGYKREVPVYEQSHTGHVSRDSARKDVGTKAGVNRDVVRTTKADGRENVGRDDVKMASSANGSGSGKEGRTDPTSNVNSKQMDIPSRDSEATLKVIVPAQRPKKLTGNDFASILAQYVYRTAKEAISVRGSAVQKSMVVQNVAKFLDLRRERENREKERAKQAALAKQKADRSASDKERGASFSELKTAHRDLIETFLRPTKPKQTKPPLPGRQPETPSKKRLRRSRFGDGHATESDQEVRPGSTVSQDGEPNSPEERRIKRRRVVLTNSPGSPDAGPTSPDGNRQNSVESVASSELFQRKDRSQPRKGDESTKPEESLPAQDKILRVEKPQIRHAKSSSLKLSSPAVGEGAIPHLVLSMRPPPSPARSGPVGSAFTTSEDSTSQVPPKPSGITKKNSSRKAKTGAKSKKKSRGQVRSSKKLSESTTDDEQYAGVLLSLNEKIKKPRSVHVAHTVEFLNETGFFDCDLDGNCKKTETVVQKARDLPKSAEDEKDDPEEGEPPERVGKCARTDIYVRADHVGQHRQRNVHARTSTSTQSSRECRQENRVYRKGVSQINPKNDIISLNHLKQRRKKVSFGQSRIHGMGLYAKEHIEAGEFIIEYVGDLIRRVVADLREKKYARQGMGDSYLFRLSGDWVVDATRRGGIARYINHSCEPNVIAKIISVVGEPKIVFYSKRSIKEGEELTYDYKFDYEAEDQKIPCLCQAPSCRCAMCNRQENFASRVETSQAETLAPPATGDQGTVTVIPGTAARPSHVTLVPHLMLSQHDHDAHVRICKSVSHHLVDP